MTVAKKKRYNYIHKSIARGTIPSILSVLASLATLTVTISLAAMSQGQGPMLLGALGITSMIFSVFALIHLVTALKDEGRNYLPVKIAGFIAGVILLIWITIIFVGLRLAA